MTPDSVPIIVDTVARDDARWDTAVRALGGGVFHSSAWARYITAADPTAVPQFLRLETHGGAHGCALGFRTRSRRPVLGALTRRVWLESAPLATDTEAAAGFMEALEESARAAGAVVLEIGSYAGGSAGPLLEKRGYAVRARLEFVIALQQPPDVLWKQMDDMRRRNIRRGGRAGVCIEELPAEVGLPLLRRLQDASFERIVRRGGSPGRYAGGLESDPLCVLVEAGVARIVAARAGGEWLSAALLTRFNGRVFYMLAGHSSRALETQSGSVLLWECINWHRSQGDHEFNLGGCPADAVDTRSVEHGIFRYKAAFGGTQVSCLGGTKVLRPVRRQITRAVYALRRQCA